jgi:tetratricopeptide (TPR) repeat protein
MTQSREAVVSSELHVGDGALSYTSGEYRFRVRLEDLALVGEFTTADGPGVDDYFLVFFTRDGARHDASFYAEGRDATLAALGDYWQAQLTIRLAASASLASNILWPASHAGQELFKFHRYAATSLMGRVRERLGLVAIQQDLSPVASEVLAIARIEAMLDEARSKFDSDPLDAVSITIAAMEQSSRIYGHDTSRVHVRGRALKEHGNALFMTGKLREALAAATKAQEIFGEDPALGADRAAATLLMALVSNELKDHNRALSLLDECASVFELQADHPKGLVALEIRATTLFDLERFEDALATFQTARSGAEESGWQVEIARIDLNIARCLVNLDRLEEATSYLERAERSFAALGMQTEILRARWCRAEMMDRSGMREEALMELKLLQPEFAQRGLLGTAGVADDIKTKEAA